MRSSTTPPPARQRDTSAPALRVSIFAHMTEQHLRYLEGAMNVRARLGHAVLNAMVGAAADYIRANRPRPLPTVAKVVAK